MICPTNSNFGDAQNYEADEILLGSIEIGNPRFCPEASKEGFGQLFLREIYSTYKSYRWHTRFVSSAYTSSRITMVLEMKSWIYILSGRICYSSPIWVYLIKILYLPETSEILFERNPTHSTLNAKKIDFNDFKITLKPILRSIKSEKNQSCWMYSIFIALNPKLEILFKLMMI